MKTLVIGRTGQLASHLKDLLTGDVFWGRADHDLNDPISLQDAIFDLKPSCIVNAAAYTAVDKAESEPDKAWRVNVDAVTVIARSAEALKIPLVHVSTDYVFDGSSDKPYKVDDPTSPLNVYGRSKLAGELAVSSLCSQFWIFRTSWVFSEYGANFVKTMLRLGADRTSLSVVDDQIGIPTYARNLAELIVKTLQMPVDSALESGIYHATGGRAVSWCEFARSIFKLSEQLGLLSHAVDINPIPSSEYPTPAVRPASSVLAASPELTDRINYKFDWETGLKQMLTEVSLN